jgi:hypothetical protein
MHLRHVGVVSLIINNTTTIHSPLYALPPWALPTPMASMLQRTSRRRDLAVREKAVRDLLHETYSLASQSHLDEIASQAMYTCVSQPYSVSSKPQDQSKLTSAHRFVSYPATDTPQTSPILRHHPADSGRSAHGSQSLHAGTFRGSRSVQSETFHGIPCLHTSSQVLSLGVYRLFRIRDLRARGLG